ncbi:MAG: glycosyltransferase family 4 protein [Gammaproteobacteria bacterium]
MAGGTIDLKLIALTSNTTWYLFNFRIGTIRALIEQHFKVVVIAPWDEFSLRLRELGCDVYDIEMDNKGSSPIADAKTFLAYRKLYRTLQPDLVLHFTIKPNIYGTLAARSLGLPCINMVSGLGTAFIRESWLTRIVERLYKLSQSWPRKVFFQNMDDMGLFVERGLVPAEKVERVPGSGVNLTQFIAAPPASNSSTVFLLIARMLRDKGVLEFVEAARLVKARHPKVRFQLLGQLGVANRTAILREQVDGWVAEEVVEYLGETDNVAPYIANADCVVLPSYREGISRILLEASAMARPIVATDVAGCREVVDDGETGYLCKVKDPVDLANILERMLMLTSEQRAEMGRKGREKMQREFDERIVIRRYLEVIDEVIKNRE